MNEIRMIPIAQLAHHPENPRLDIGDLTELTASIKANGILQNLSVVFEPEHTLTPKEWSDLSDQYSRKPTEEVRTMMNKKTMPDRYLVVIGNRRLEAAKAAGLTELPCSVMEINHQEQIATMLQENMQRSDLTIYEQAKGIQMMMDLGFDKDQISERTGFSKTTIERRLAVATLPPDETKEAVGDGYDLIDLVEISKIEDPKAQKKLLTGTNRNSLKQAIEIARKDQERAGERKRILPEVKRFATEMTEAQQTQRYGNGWEHLHKYDVKLEPGSEVKVPKEEGKYFFMESWGTIEIYRKAKKEKHVKTEQEIALEKRQHDAKELNSQMRERRIAFLNTFTPTKKLTAQLQEKMIEWAFDWKSSYENGGFYSSYHSWSNSLFREMCKMPIEEGRDKDESILEEIERRNIPMGRAILSWMLCGAIKADDRSGYASEYNGQHKDDDDMDDVYEILLAAGYEMSDEEQQWKDGTHPFYGNEPDATPEDKEEEKDPEEDGEEEPEEE